MSATADSPHDESGRPGPVTTEEADLMPLATAAHAPRGEGSLRLLVEHIPDCVMRFDPEGRCLYANPAVRAIYGGPVEELIGKSLTDLPGSEGRRRGREGLARLLQRAVQERAPNRVEGRWETELGERWFDLLHVPEFDDMGEVVSVLGIARDVTERRRAEDELRTSRERFRVYVEHALDAFFVHDWEGRILDVNAKACDQLGYSRNELLGMPLSQLDAAVRAEDVPAFRAQLMAEGRLTLETRHRRKDGSTIPVEVRLRVLDESSGAASFLALARDLTDEKRDREALTLFRSLLDRANDTIEVVDPESARFLDVNERACRDSGYTREEYLDLTVFDVDPNVDRARWVETVEQLRRRESIVFDSVHRRKDGSTFPVEVVVTLTQLDREYLLAVVRDVTDRKRTEADLTASHNLLNAVVESTVDVVFAKDLDDRVLMVNSAGADAIGRPAEEILGSSTKELVPPERAHEVREQDEQLLKSGAPVTYEATNEVEGRTRTYLATKSLFRDPQGDPAGIVVLSRDVTELKQLERQFHEAQRLESIGRLAGGVAHDFNNLLTAINGYTELVLKRFDEDDPDRSRLLQVRKAGERAANLTRQLLAFSRKQVLQTRVVNLNSVLHGLVDLLGQVIGEDVDLRFEPFPNLGMTRIDQDQFEQAVMNLAVNARDAMPDGGLLEIRTSEAVVGANEAAQLQLAPGAYVRVAVRDTGLGMSDAIRATIFEPFVTTKEAGEGTGLGLAMVYGFVKQSEGHIEVNSAEGEGATFCIWLPQTQEPAPVEEPPALPLPAEAPRGNEAVLLVEDGDSVRDLSALLLRSAGYTVLEASDGLEALEVAAGHDGSLDLLVTDVVMPRMGGRELSRRLRESRPLLPTLFMSGYAARDRVEPEDKDETWGFMQKPFTPQGFAVKVRELLDKASSRA